MDVTSILILLAVGAGLAIMFIRQVKQDSSLNGSMIESANVVKLLKKQEEKKRKRVEDAQKNYLEHKLDYERKFGPITSSDVNGSDGPSSAE